MVGIEAKQSLDHAIEHSFERASVVREKQLLAEALMHGVGSVSVDAVKGEAAAADVIVKDVGGVRYATTKQVYREETDMVAFVRVGRGTCKKLSSQKIPLESGLNPEQREAAEKMIASRDQVIGLRGGAGILAADKMKDPGARWSAIAGFGVATGVGEAMWRERIERERDEQERREPE